MYKLEEILIGAVGTSLSAVGTATQTNSTLETVSLIITIIGAFISFIFLPLWNWWKRAKADKKITKEEIKEGIDTLIDGIGEVSDSINKNKNKGDKKDEH